MFGGSNLQRRDGSGAYIKQVLQLLGAGRDEEKHQRRRAGPEACF